MDEDALEEYCFTFLPNAEFQPAWNPYDAEHLRTFLEGKFRDELQDSDDADTLAEERACERIEALESGSAPTEDELAYYAENYFELKSEGSGWKLFSLTRKALPSGGDSDQDASAYYLTEYDLLGQYCDRSGKAGPFSSLEEAVAALYDPEYGFAWLPDSDIQPYNSDLPDDLYDALEEGLEKAVAAGG
jgi:hypothetical protein